VSIVARVRPDADQDVLARRTGAFEPRLSTAGEARQLLTAALRAAGRERWADAGVLALSEVVSNAALHAHTRIEVLVEVHDDHLWAEVSDGSALLPQQRQYDQQATTGRGMALVAALTDECGVYSLGPAGKVVWFRLGDGDPSATSEQDLLAAWDLDGEDEGPVDDAGLVPPEQTRTVVLDAMPVTLWLAARQHHDALLRELVLYEAEHTDVQVDLPLADAARNLVMEAVLEAVDAAQQAGTATPAVPPGHPAPLPPVPARFALHLDVPLSLRDGYVALQRALDMAERLALAGRLLARPGLPEVVAVRDWVCDQVVCQLAGQPSLPWGGTAQARFETAVTDRFHEVAWDDTAVRESPRGVVAADDANRIVAMSRSLAELLGWQVDDIVGRRVVTLIPPALREAHVAGFTRHLTTGEGHIIGVQVTLPVLHADGHEILCHFTVERAPVTGGRAVYLAFLEPADEPGA
jgi:PAS domain S-box-containing protein